MFNWKKTRKPSRACAYWYVVLASDDLPHPMNKKYFQKPFLVLQLVTNRGLMSVPGRTNQYLEEPQ